MTQFFDGPKPRLFAHRGASGEAPENTLVAFERAVELGCEYIELDVRASQDGHIMVFHDNTLDRTTNGRGAVGDYSRAALQQLDAGYRFSPAPSSETGQTRPFRASDVVIPSLEEVFSSFPNVRFTVEIKQAEPAIEAQVVAVVNDCGKARDVVLASEHDAVLRRVRALAPGIVTSFGFQEVADFVQRVATDRLDDYRPPGQALQIPPSYQDIPLVTQATLGAARRFDLEMHVWTINEPDEMHRLLNLGVDGVMSDFPERLLAAACRSRSPHDD